MTAGREPTEPPDRPAPAAPRTGSAWTEFATGAPGRPSPGVARGADAGADATMPWTPVAPPRPTGSVDATRVMPVVPAGPAAGTARTPAVSSSQRRVDGSTSWAALTRTGSDPLVPARPPALIGRFVVALAGLLSAGCLLLGIALAILQVAAPRLGGTGLEYATGPGWPAAAATLAVGSLGEAAFWLTVRSSRPIRIAVATGVVLAVLAVLALVWWR